MMRRSVPCIAFAIGSAAGLLAVGAEPEPEAEPLEIGPDTTVVEGPLRQDRTVDYAVALNARYGEGVTPDNNAFAVIAELMAPDSRGFAAVRPAVFEMLGTAMPGDDADYFEPLRTYAERRAAEEEHGPWNETVEPEPDSDDEWAPRFREPRWQYELYRAENAPWSPDDAPLIAEWLADQQEALDRLSEGIRRDRYWSPYVMEDEDDLLIAILLPNLGTLRDMATGLRTRALHRLHEQDIDGAVEDVLALKRLSGHLADTATPIEQLVGMAIAAMATDVIGHLAGHEGLTAERARTLQADLAPLRGRFPFAEALGNDRFIALDFLQRPWHHAEAAGFEFEAADERLHRIIDRERGMRRVNAFYDRIVEAADAPDRAERIKRLAAIEAEVDTMRQRLDSPSLVWLGIALGHRGVITDAVTDRLLGILMHSMTRPVTTADRVEMLDHLELVALAVAGHRAEHGEYPPALDALTPDWLDAIPADLFDPDHGPVRYRVEDGRVVIYSVSENGEDNGGLDDRYDGDLVIEWPTR